MSNQLFHIEAARVANIGKFETGVSNNGPWASFGVLLEYEVAGSEGATAKARACVNFRGDLAKWASENVRPGNPYDSTPDMYLTVDLRPWGDIQQMKRQDGSIYFKNSNVLQVENVQIANNPIR